MKSDPPITLARCVSFAVGSLLFLSGCASTAQLEQQQTDFQTTLPSTWTNAGDHTATFTNTELSSWWSTFNDPQLTALIDEALVNNTDIRSSLSTIRQARAQRGLENAALWPSLSGSAGASESHSRNRDSGNHQSSQSYNAGLDASWEIDLFGQQRKYIEASDAELQATIEDTQSAQISLAAEVAQTYFSLRSAEAQLSLVEQTLASREETQQLIEWQETAGEADALNTQQGLTSVEQVRAQIPQQEQNIEELRNSLAILTGQTPQALQSLWTTSGTFPSAPESLNVGIPAETLKQRPDIRAAEQRILAASANLDATERSRLPSLNLSGSIGIEALEAGDLFDPTQIISSALASLSAPIWDAGRIRRNTEIQYENLVQSYLNYQSVTLDALAEVENALKRIDTQSRQLKSLGNAADAASQAAEMAQLQYESGEADLLTVLDTQRSELSLKQSRISAQADLLSAQVQLYKALGGTWSTSTEYTQLLINTPLFL
jgi:efflux transporter, outer membrane factor (OMF) lipoprotein, NodT family